MQDTKRQDNKLLDKLMPQLAAIPDDEVQRPHNIPVSEFITEASFLVKWAQKDKERLVAAGLDWPLVDDIPLRLEALSEAQVLASVKQEDNPLEAAWKRQASKAVKLRDELLRYYRFVFHNDPDMKKRIKATAHGKRYAGLTQELNDLVALSSGKEEQLMAAGFDLSLLEQAAEAVMQTAAFYAKITAARRGQDEAQVTRNRAYTYLKQAVDEIRRVGRFVFQSDKDRLTGYRSRYLYKKNSRYGKKKAVDGDPPKKKN